MVWIWKLCTTSNIRIIPVGVFNGLRSQCIGTPHGTDGIWMAFAKYACEYLKKYTTAHLFSFPLQWICCILHFSLMRFGIGCVMQLYAKRLSSICIEWGQHKKVKAFELKKQWWNNSTTMYRLVNLIAMIDRGRHGFRQFQNPVRNRFGMRALPNLLSLPVKIRFRLFQHYWPLMVRLLLLGHSLGHLPMAVYSNPS